MNREVKINSFNHQKKSASPQRNRQKSGSLVALKNSSQSKIRSTHSRKKIGSRHQKRSQKKPIYSLIYPLGFLIRLTIITVGISTIIGSGISLANSFNTNLTLKNPNDNSENSAISETQSSQLENLFSLISVGQEIAPLKQELQRLTQQYPQLEAGIFLADIDNKTFVNIKGTKTFSSASTIKLPVLIAFFQDVDAGKIDLDELLATSKKNIGTGSGYMQYEPVGSKFSALKTATKMITVSDNTATNMLIERLGGASVLNQRFADWGLTATKIRNPLPDLTGTNTTTPEDLGNLLLKIDRGELVSLASRDRIFEIMKQTQRNTLLPQGLEKDATIAHKTGDILSVLGDTGLINLPNGKRYIASVLVKRPDNDPQAKSLIQEVSRVAYQYFQQQPSQSSTVSNQPRSFIVE